MYEVRVDQMNMSFLKKASGTRGSVTKPFMSVVVLPTKEVLERLETRVSYGNAANERSLELPTSRASFVLTGSGSFLFTAPSPIAGVAQVSRSSTSTLQTRLDCRPEVYVQSIRYSLQTWLTRSSYTSRLPTTWPNHPPGFGSYLPNSGSSSTSSSFHQPTIHTSRSTSSPPSRPQRCLCSCVADSTQKLTASSRPHTSAIGPRLPSPSSRACCPLPKELRTQKSTWQDLMQVTLSTFHDLPSTGNSTTWQR